MVNYDYIKIKRYIDLVLCFEGLVFFWWVYPLCAVAVKIDDPDGPIIFKQDRIGQYGKIYKMLKFRSMKTDSEHTGSGVYSEKGDSRVLCQQRFHRDKNRLASVYLLNDSKVVS